MATKKSPAKKSPAKASGTRRPAKAKATPAKDAKDAPAKGPGVISTIFDLLKATTKDSPLTKEQLLAKLVKAFPDREPTSMARTIGVQVPGRMSKERGVKIKTAEEGGYYIA